jgi:glyoxylase-like metal-dependent hydrolase (beta-lactamase superfamily II)
MPMGGFLLRSGDRTILVDAGLGPNIDIVETRGKLFDSLADLGVTPEQITDVVLTHLHLDHVGWVAPAGEPTFTHARHHCHRADYDWMRADPGSNPATAGVTFRPTCRVGSRPTGTRWADPRRSGGRHAARQ